MKTTCLLISFYKTLYLKVPSGVQFALSKLGPGQGKSPECSSHRRFRDLEKLEHIVHRPQSAHTPSNKNILRLHAFRSQGYGPLNIHFMIFIMPVARFPHKVGSRLDACL